ncbi:MAG: hypothetical protein U0Z75_02210 [Deinococcaceae bacterium]
MGKYVSGTYNLYFKGFGFTKVVDSGRVRGYLQGPILNRNAV